MNARIGTCGAVFGASAVAVGAFGAHALKARLAAAATTETFDLAVRYHFWHALALVACAFLPAGRATRAAAWMFGLGTAVFSGSLYVLALTGLKMLGAVTPFGGGLLIAGWVATATAFRRAGRGSAGA